MSVGKTNGIGTPHGAIAAADLLATAGEIKFRTILADPPWQFKNRTGKVAPEHKRLARYATLSLDDIKALPVSACASETAHLYRTRLPQGALTESAIS